jgi:hypothetical protein
LLLIPYNRGHTASANPAGHARWGDYPDGLGEAPFIILLVFLLLGGL